MGDRLFQDLEIAMSSYNSKQNGYNEEEEETDGDYEEEEEEVNNSAENGSKSDELACPFCFEDFDVLGLCCHIDADHRLEVKPGICPFCTTKVGINMASHVITQHESLLKALSHKKHCSGRARSAIFGLRKELLEKHLHCIKESPSFDSSSDGAAESMLLSFVNNNPETAWRPQTVEAAATPTESGRTAGDDSLERTRASTTTNMKNEKCRRCEFVQGLVFSTFLDDL